VRIKFAKLRQKVLLRKSPKKFNEIIELNNFRAKKMAQHLAPESFSPTFLLPTAFN